MLLFVSSPAVVLVEAVVAVLRSAPPLLTIKARAGLLLDAWENAKALLTERHIRQVILDGGNLIVVYLLLNDWR